MLLNTAPTLRHATQADWPAIEALLLANKLPTEGAQARLNTCLLAVSNGEVVGSAGTEVYERGAHHDHSTQRGPVTVIGLDADGELAHPEPGLYTIGVKSRGRAPTFLMATGFEQARSVVAAIAGDLEAGDRVELDLPETGVCGLGTADASGAESSCCGDAPVTIAANAPKVGCSTMSCGTKPAVAVVASATTTRCCG